ncbi:Uncharacterised protein [Comamonas testosteroni]|uniref:Uncharacterized protein n=1 Tax=Comamonas testosteroni TaxID=285 RepID=A0A8B4S672_COMTE|nr:hypothetical protein DFO48_1167 [Comamonas sp. AG1104]SUY78632.1 Uncharacterised protein [Comamonas testosteroni]
MRKKPIRTLHKLLLRVPYFLSSLGRMCCLLMQQFKQWSNWPQLSKRQMKKPNLRCACNLQSLLRRFQDSKSLF